MPRLGVNSNYCHFWCRLRGVPGRARACGSHKCSSALHEICDVGQVSDFLNLFFFPIVKMELMIPSSKVCAEGKLSSLERIQSQFYFCHSGHWCYKSFVSLASQLIAHFFQFSTTVSQLFLSIGWVAVNNLVKFPKACFSHLHNGKWVTMIRANNHGVPTMCEALC